MWKPQVSPDHTSSKMLMVSDLTNKTREERGCCVCVERNVEVERGDHAARQKCGVVYIILTASCRIRVWFRVYISAQHLSYSHRLSMQPVLTVTVFCLLVSIIRNDYGMGRCRRAPNVIAKLNSQEGVAVCQTLSASLCACGVLQVLRVVTNVLIAFYASLLDSTILHRLHRAYSLRCGENFSFPRGDAVVVRV